MAGSLGLDPDGTPPFIDAISGTHTYTVRALNGACVSSESTADNGTGIATPAAPTNVSATDTQCEQITISWNTVAGATGYEIFRDGGSLGLDPDGTPPFIDTVTGTHSYTVRALDGACPSAQSTADNGTGSATPAAPTNVSATDTQCEQITISWNTVAGATDYEVFRDGESVGFDPNRVPPYVDFVMGSHSYTVRTWTGNCVSTDSNTDSGTALECPEASACCFPDGTCLTLTASDCDSGGGTYQGDGTTCASTECEDTITGACCFSDGTCSDVNDADCASLGGTYQGDGTSCDTTFCEDTITGACCFSDGTCSDVNDADCASLGGTYQGDGTSCDTTFCEDTITGACCLPDGTCSDVNDATCASLGGTYQGDGSTCATTECEDTITGACCLPDGTCSDVNDATCTSLGGTYQGDDSTCATTECEDTITGACCLPDGTCSDVNDTTCASLGGTYQGDGSTCATTECEDTITGACCLSDGTCSDVNDTTCTSSGGTYQGDNTVCDTTVCEDIITGACCLSDGTCSDVNDTTCASSGGTYQGDNTVCDTTVCEDTITGACCLPDGTCSDLNDATCASSGGTYQGDNTVCDTTVCEDTITGACCLPDGTCSDLNDATCASSGGTYQGDNTVCDTTFCEDTITGACCVPDGTCSDLNDATCASSGGTYQGDNTVCDTTVCEDTITGACCLPDGTCSDLNDATCASSGGTYQGDNTVCDTTFCEDTITGACCVPDGTCSDLNDATCASSGGTYQGDNTVCDTTVCEDTITGACCLPDGTCSDLNDATCASSGGTYQGDNTVCDTTVCEDTITGACCLPDGTCSDLNDATCASSGGTYQGDNTVCDTTFCEDTITGACCFPDGTCSDVNDADCASLGGTYQGDDTSCDTTFCDVTVTGACCFADGSCVSALQADCESADWTEDATCTPSPCPTLVSDVQVIETGTNTFEWEVATDEEVTRVHGWYRPAGSRPDPCEPGRGEFLCLGELQPEGTSTWHVSFPGEHKTLRGIEYYLAIEHPRIPPGTAQMFGCESDPLYVEIEGAARAPLPAPLTLRMISAPYDISSSDRDLSALEAFFGAPRSSTTWDMGWWEDTGDTGHYVHVGPGRPLVFERSQAYWIGTAEPQAEWRLSGISRRPIDSDDTECGDAAPWEIELAPGWNMVGNPAFYRITLNQDILEVRSSTGETHTYAEATDPLNTGGIAWVGAAIYVYAPNSGLETAPYDPAPPALDPWDGCWILNRLTTPLYLRIPAREAESVDPALIARWTPEDLAWSVLVEARTADSQGRVVVGRAPKASGGLDPMDLQHPPEAPGSRLWLALESQTSYPRRDWLYRDVRSTDQVEERWTVHVSSPEAPVDLTWHERDSRGTAPEGALKITRLADGREWDMRALRSLQVGRGEHSFVITFEANGPAAPPQDAPELLIKPNPFRGETIFFVKLARSGRFDLHVFDSSGALCWSERRDRAEAGQHAILWDGRSNDGASLPAGAYFLRLNLVSEDGHLRTSSRKFTLLR